MAAMDLTGAGSVRAFLDALASREPTPGGGGAAALAVAMGAALVAMTARLTVGRRRYAAVETEMQTAIARADRIRDQALDLVAADARAYAGVLAAYALPHTSEPETAARTAALARAATDASQVPLQVAARAAEVVDLAAFAVEHGNRNVIADAGAAAALARAAIRISELNVVANRALIDAAATRNDLERALIEMRSVRDRTDGIVERAIDAMPA